MTGKLFVPTEVEDDGDVAGARALFCPEDRNGKDAFARYWNTPQGVVLQSMHSNEDVRGRTMIQWLFERYGPLIIVEAVPSALGFWQRMKQEGMVLLIEDASIWGEASTREGEAIPFSLPLFMQD